MLIIHPSVINKVNVRLYIPPLQNTLPFISLFQKWERKIKFFRTELKLKFSHKLNKHKIPDTFSLFRNFGTFDC